MTFDRVGHSAGPVLEKKTCGHGEVGVVLRHEDEQTHRSKAYHLTLHSVKFFFVLCHLNCASDELQWLLVGNQRSYLSCSFWETHCQNAMLLLCLDLFGLIGFWTLPVPDWIISAAPVNLILFSLPDHETVFDSVPTCSWNKMEFYFISVLLLRHILKPWHFMVPILSKAVKSE